MFLNSSLQMVILDFDNYVQMINFHIRNPSLLLYLNFSLWSLCISLHPDCLRSEGLTP